MIARSGPGLSRAALVAMLGLLTLGAGTSLGATPSSAEAGATADAAPVHTLRPGCAVSGNVVAAADRLMKDRYTLGLTAGRPPAPQPHLA